MDAEKVRLLKSLTSYLHNRGITATLSKEPAPASLSLDRREQVVTVQGSNIDRIVVEASPYVSCGGRSDAYRFKYELALNTSLSPALIKQINTSMKPIRSRKANGLGTSAVIEVIWHGQELAERLNTDKELTGTLLEAAKQTDYPEIEIFAGTATVVTILGPWFSEPPHFLKSGNGTSAISGNDGLYRLETYERIAEHIKKVISSTRISEKTGVSTLD